MTIQEVLNEVYVDRKDMLPWIKKILVEKGITKPVNIHVGANHTLPNKWHDADAQTGYFYKDGKVKDIYDVKGFKFHLTNPEQMLLVTHIYPKTAELYIHPDATNTAAIGKVEDLTDNEKIVLLATRMYKGSYAGDKNYRFTEANRMTKISRPDWVKAVESLRSKKMLDGRKSITTLGRNAIEGKNWNDFI